MENRIHPSGKIWFNSPAEGVKIQSELLSLGFRFAHGHQAVRPEALGVMWVKDSHAGPLMRTAANRHVWPHYHVQERESLYLPEPKPEKPSKPRQTLAEKQAQCRRAAEIYKKNSRERVFDLMPIIIQAMREIGQYEPLLWGINSRSQARIVAWDALLRKILSLCTEKPHTANVREALHRVMREKGKRYKLPDNRRMYPIIREWKPISS